MPEIVQEIGAAAGIAAVVGLAVLSALYFSQARDVKRLREWAGRAPERADTAAPAAVPGRVVAQPQTPQAAQARPGGPPPVPTPRPAAAAAAGATPATAQQSKPVQGTPGTPVPATAAGAAGAAAGVAAAGAAGAAAKPDGAPGEENAKAAETGPGGAKPGQGAQPGGADAKPAGNGEAGSADAKPDGDEAKPDGDEAKPGTPEPVGAQAGGPATAAAAAGAAAAASGAAASGAGASPSSGAASGTAPPGSAGAPSGTAAPVSSSRPTAPVGASAPPPVAPRRAPQRPAARQPGGRSPQETQIIPPRRQEPWYRRLGGTYIALIVVGVLVVGGGIAFGVSQLTKDDDPGSGNVAQTGTDKSDGSGEQNSKGGAAVKPGDVTVAVLNGTTVPGLAATLSDQVSAAGFKIGTITNFSDQQLAESVVQYAPGHQAEARAVSRRVGIAQREPVSPSSRALAGDATVVVIAGSDKSP